MPVSDELTGFVRTNVTQNLINQNAAYTGTVDALDFGQGAEFLDPDSVEGGDGGGTFSMDWMIDAFPPNSTIELEYSFFVDAWSGNTNAQGGFTSAFFGPAQLLRVINRASLGTYLGTDDLASEEIFEGGTVTHESHFGLPVAAIATHPHPTDTTDLAPNITRTPQYDDWVDPLLPPDRHFVGGNHPSWFIELQSRGALGFDLQDWTPGWENNTTGYLPEAARTALATDDVWAPSRVAQFDEEYTWNINLRVSQTDLFEEFQITDTLPFGWEYVPGSARIIDGDWIQRFSPVTEPAYRVLDLEEPTVTPGTATECSAPYGAELGDQLDWTFNVNDEGPRPIWDIRYLDRRDNTLDNATIVENEQVRLGVDADNLILIQFDAIPRHATTDCNTDDTIPGHIFMENRVDMVATPLTVNDEGESFVLGSGYDVSNTQTQFNTMIAPVGFPVSLNKTPDNEIISDDTTSEFVVEFTNYGDIDLPNKTLFDTMVTTPGASAQAPENWAPFHDCGDATAQFRDLDGNLTPAPGFSEVCNVTINDDNTHQHDFEWTIANLPVDTTLVITVPLVIPDKDDVPEAIANNTTFTNSVTVDVPEYETTLEDDGDIDVRFPSPPPPATVQVIANGRPAINEIVNWRTQFTMPVRQFYQDLIYTTTVPAGQTFEGYGEVVCFAAGCDVSQVETLPPVENPDGTTTIGWWFNDVSSSALGNNLVRMPWDARVDNEYDDGDLVVHGDTHTATATGFAHQEDLLDEPPALDEVTASDPPEDASGSAFFYDSRIHTAASIVDEPQIEVTKTATPSTDPVDGSSTIDYVITVSNLNTFQDAYNVVLEDFPGVALENVQVTSTQNGAFFTDGWTELDPRIAWFIPVVADRTTQTFRYTAEVADDFSEVPIFEARNTVRVDGGYLGTNKLEPGPNDRVYGPTEFIETVVPLVGPEISITKHVDGCVETVAQATAGQATSWCLQVTNSGTAPALGVEVTDELPTGWSYEADSALITGATLANDEPTETSPASATLLNWVVGDIDPGTTVTIEFEATPAPGSPLTVTNEAFAQAFVVDGPDDGDELDPAPVGVGGFFDSSTAVATLTDHALQIAKSAERTGEPVALSGGPVNWTITVTNPFDTDLTNVEVVDFLPDGFTYTPGSATSDDGVGFSETSVDVDGPGDTTEITWTVDSLAGNESFTIELPSAVEANVAAGEQSNIVEATATEVSDPVLFEAVVNLYPVSTIGDFVWVDNDFDGVQDTNEVGLNGVVVTLTNTAGEPLFRNPDTGEVSTVQGDTGVALVATTGDDPSTNAVETGWYAIENVPPGDYRLTFATPAGHTPTFRDRGGDDDADSDINPVTGQTSVVSVEANVDVDDVDAGFVVGEAAEITGTAWNDDGDGVNEVGESVRPGVTVNLLDEAGNVIATTTTGTNGSYTFSNLPPGDFIIEFGLQAGHSLTEQNVGDEGSDSDVDQTTGRVPVSVASGGSSVIDAGYVELGSIAGEAWADDDGDGVNDTDEDPLAGVVVELRNADGDVVTTTMSGTDGAYSFAGLFPDDYTVRFIAPDDHVTTFQDRGEDDENDSDIDRVTGQVVVPVTAGEDVTDIDGGFVPATLGPDGPPDISGVAWQDDADGIREAGEGPVAGVVVNLLSPSGEVLATTTTDEFGAYLFEGVAPGEYEIEFVTPEGESITFQDQGTDDTADSDIDPETGRVSLTLGTEDAEIDGGYVTGDPGVINGAGWVDNGNGIRDPGEDPHAGVTVNLIGPNGEVVATTTTSSTGTYEFTNVPPGSYEIGFVTPAGHLITTEGEGDDEDSDSDISQTTGRAPVTLPSGGSATVDAGHVPTSSISGAAWIDNFDGIRDGEEEFEEGVTVRLLDSEGNVVQTTTTGPNGEYEFIDLFPGEYEVEFVTPEGLLITQSGAGTDGTVDSNIDQTTGRAPVTVVAGSNNANVDAGFGPQSEISGVAWIDDGDGIRQDTETLEAGVAVELRDAEGAVVATTTTLTNGSYEFSGLYPGDYTVEFTTPTDHSTTFADQGDDESVDSDVDRVTGEVAVPVGVGTVTENVDAGYIPGVPARISGLAWSDANSDGVREDDDTFREGVVVELVNADGTVLATTTTLANGSYEFVDVPPGDYTVRFLTPDGDSITFADQGDDDTTDSDIDPVTGEVAITVAGVDITDIDAGFVEGESGTITGAGWTDNGNGIREPGEEPHVGVTVNLLSSTGEIVATTTTGPNGEYSFTTVPPGEYAVQFVTPTEHNNTVPGNGEPGETVSTIDPTNGQAAITLTSGGTEAANAGFVPFATIAGTTWTDDGNGVREAQETQLAGVTVNLLDVDGNVVDTVVTNEEGEYEFIGVFPGEYSVEFVSANGEILTFTDRGGDDSVDSDPNRATGIVPAFAIEAGETINGIDAGYLGGETGEIAGTAWIDEGNGVREPGEDPLEGIIVTLYGPNGEVLATTMTGSGGEYSFTGVPTGNYEVGFTTPLGFIPTLSNQGDDESRDSDSDPATGRAPVEVAAGEQSEASAGFVEAEGPASIGGTFWDDEDNNGIRDDDEAGIEGETVELVDADGVVIATTITGPNGEYNFTNLPPGTYSVQFPPPGEYAYAFEGRGDDDTRDSDVSRVTGRSAPVTAVAGQQQNVDAGAVVPGPAATVRGTAFIDPNVDGQRGRTETTTPPGVVINLVDAVTGEIVASTMPGDDPSTPEVETGYYEFTFIPPGEYTIEFVDESGLLLSPSGDLNAPGDDGTTPVFVLAAGEVLEINAGFSEPVTIGGLIWFDTNRDGIRDADEDERIPDVNVLLLQDGAGSQSLNADVVTQSQSDVVATLDTDGNGEFLFEGLLAGDYQVLFEFADLPEGTEVTLQTQGGDITVDSNADVTTGLTAIIETEPGDNVRNIDLGIADPEVDFGDPPGALAFTGSEPFRAALFAALLAILGFVLLRAARRRKEAPLH